MSGLANRVAIVTAGTKGIGFSIVKRLAKDGVKVVFCSRKQQNVDEALKDLQTNGLSAVGVAAHVGKYEDRRKVIDAALTNFGRIDCLVSNAAANPFFGPLLQTPPDAWEKTYATNVTASFELCREVVPELKKSDYASRSIVFVASIAAFRPLSGLGVYNVSKTALVGLSKNLAMELAADNIRCNTVAPGIIQTDFSKTLWDNPKILAHTLKEIPQGRVAHPDEVAGSVAFLLGNDAAYITGETITVSGGMQGFR